MNDVYYPELVKNYIDYLTADNVGQMRGGQYALDNYGLDKIKQGVAQGLNHGVYDIDDWIKQYNAGGGRNNPINIPQTQQEIENARINAFNKFFAPQQDNQPVNTQPGYQPEVPQDNHDNQQFNNFRSRFINDLMSGYNENLNNGFKAENWNTNQNKSVINRLGELAGSAVRFAKRPGVQSLVAGGIATALTGSPLYGAKVATQFNQNLNNSKMYSDMLKKEGVNTDFGIGSYITNDAFKNSTGLIKDNKTNQTTKENNEKKLAEDIRKNKTAEQLNRVKEILKGYADGVYNANMTSILLMGEGWDIPPQELTESNDKIKAIAYSNNQNALADLNAEKQNTEKTRQEYNQAGTKLRGEQANTEKSKQTHYAEQDRTEKSKQADNYASANAHNARANKTKEEAKYVGKNSGGGGRSTNNKSEKDNVQPFDSRIANSYFSLFNDAPTRKEQQEIALKYKEITGRDLFKDVHGLELMED